ncbi:MAG TPA: hypothetical protein VKU01_20660 [Bryobacteraceae bacterium]|nr:hypothetical protein [Bryobacteraceae bacterium]
MGNPPFALLARFGAEHFDLAALSALPALVFEARASATVAISTADGALIETVGAFVQPSLRLNLF